MSLPKFNEIDPDGDFSAAITATLAEWNEHIEVFMARPNYQLAEFDDKHQLVPLITTPLINHWWALPESRRLDLKKSLQYLLNLDEEMPISKDATNTAPYIKEGSLAQKIRDSCQHAMVPSDGYALCQRMWEILFENEDWHTDIGNWIVTKRWLEIR